MPVKRRIDKHGGLSPGRLAALIDGPENVLLGGLDDYYLCGCNWVHAEQPERRAAAEAAMLADWRRFGAGILAEHAEPWALVQFGAPHAC